MRIVRKEDGALAAQGSSCGRGAWLCRGSAACLERAARRRMFERAFKAPVAAEAVEGLRRELGLGPDVGG